MPSKRLPSVAEYRTAFEAVRPRLTELQWNLLEAHFTAPNHTATARELSLVAGGDTYRATNGAYGNLGIKLRRVLQRPKRNGEAQVSILTGFWGRDLANPEARLAMHGPAVRALSNLGWFDEETRAVVGARSTTITRLSAREGQIRRQLVVHRSRERSLRPAKLRAVMAAARDGRLRCEVPGCGFDFEAAYGRQGHGAAEVHHKKPLAEAVGEIETSLDDLAVVCANCHRMIHLDGECRAMSELLTQRNEATARRLRTG